MSCLSRWGKETAFDVFCLRFTCWFRRGCAGDWRQYKQSTFVSVQKGQPQIWSKLFGTGSTLFLALGWRCSSGPGCVLLAAWKRFNWSLPNSCNAVLFSTFSCSGVFFFFLFHFTSGWLIARLSEGKDKAWIIHDWLADYGGQMLSSILLPPLLLGRQEKLHVVVSPNLD